MMAEAAFALAAAAILLFCPRAFGAEPCSAVFYTQAELPKVHQIDLVMPLEKWRAMVDNQANRDYGEVPTTIVFNNHSYTEGRVEIHGGTPQRQGVPPMMGPMDCGVPSVNPINTGNVAARNDVQGWCKPGFRVHFSKQDPFNADAPWSFPAGDRCNDLDKFVLRNEWGDPKTMLRNKLSQDLFTHMGAAAPRVEYAELSVNGEYFGFYTLEERVDDHFAKCRGWPSDDGASMYKSYPVSLSKPH